MIHEKRDNEGQIWMSMSKGCSPFCLVSSIPAGLEECQREERMDGSLVLRFLKVGDGEDLESKVA